MKIESFELLNGGNGGVKVTGTDSQMKDNVTVFTPITKTYPIPLPDDITANVEKLKKYLLEITNHWPRAYFEFVSFGKFSDSQEHINKPGYEHAKFIYENTEIKKVYRKKNGYILTGVMESKESARFFNINTPLIDPDDGYDRFSALQKGIEYCFNAIAGFIADPRLLMKNPRQLAMNFWGEDSSEAERLAALNDKDVEEIVIKHLETKGMLVINMDETGIGDKAIEAHADEVPADEAPMSDAEAEMHVEQAVDDQAEGERAEAIREMAAEEEKPKKGKKNGSAKKS